jgi:protein SCO1/2
MHKHTTQTFLKASLVILLTLPSISHAQATHTPEAASYDADAALQHSQAAIGRQLGDYELTGTDGNPVRLSDYADKPLLVSLIFTSCYHTCPVVTRYLGKAVDIAREALGEGSFRVITVGFDTANDTPEAMRVFAREQGIDVSGWDFLSASEETIAGLVDDLGFVHFPSPRGFDHIVQVTVVDRDGVVYRQAYGAMFEIPWLVEPLKELVFNNPQTNPHSFSGLLDQIRFFCTVYDPTTGRYETDYSLFIQIAVGLLVVLSVAYYLLLERWRAHRRRQGRG